MMLLSAKQLFVIKNKELENLEEKINLLHPEQVLKRGYSITRLNGKAITETSSVKAGDQLVTTLHHGELTSVVS